MEEPKKQSTDKYTFTSPFSPKSWYQVQQHLWTLPTIIEKLSYLYGVRSYLLRQPDCIPAFPSVSNAMLKDCNIEITELESRKTLVTPISSQTITKELPTTFNEIFSVDNWRPYIDILTTTEIKILVKDGDTYKIGYRTKGALLNYFADLQNEGIVKGTREGICNVLYLEVKDIGHRPDISSLTKQSQGYRELKKKLKRDIYLFPKGEFGKL